MVMATTLQQPRSSFLTLVALLVVILFISPTSSTSRKTLNPCPNAFRVTLRHVDSGKNLTKLERVQHGMKRGKSRLQRLNAIVLKASTPDSDSDSELQAPIHAGNGEYLVELSIGTPPLSYPAVLDTGSDLIWTQCKPCTRCYKQPSPIFDPNKSSSFSKVPCGDSLCSALPTSTCSDGCDYVYSYGDYSTTQGFLATETFTFGGGKNKVSVHNVGFGCGEDNEGDGFEQASGLVGLGRGPLSLVSQLKEPKFSYCLTPMDDTKTSVLLLGSLEKVKGGKKEAVTTPLIRNLLQPSFYYISLEGISVGDSKLSIEKSTFDVGDDGSGGVIIDSGTTITYLEEKAFDELKKEFVIQTKLPVDTSSSTGLDLCFTLPSGSSQVEIPKLVFHFKGGDLELPAENYMIGDANLGVVCLAMGASSGMSIFGNVQQQNILVNHDLVKETITFVPTLCDQL